MYKYELHLHTSEVSYCGKVAADNQVRFYKEIGYTGICVTDHLHDIYYKELYSGSEWQKYIDYHIHGYELAKEAGIKYGLEVILGMEIRFPGSDLDYLCYGIDERWLRDNPDVCAMGLPAFYEKFHNDILIIQAHPFRNNDSVMTEYLHGIEIVNPNVRNDSRNELAYSLAKQYPHLLRLAGSDAHRECDVGRAAVLLEERVTDSFGLRDALLSRKFSLSCPDYAGIIQRNEEDLRARA